MNINEMIREMEKGYQVISLLLAKVTPEEACIKPDADSWSFLEVLCHLVDEEREDFRKHIEQAFSDPQPKWHAINPAGWVTERRYQEQSLDSVLTKFRIEREDSLHWLKSLQDAHWNIKIEAPFGQISAGDLLAAWVMHDNLNIRQLVEIRQILLQKKNEPFNSRYAG